MKKALSFIFLLTIAQMSFSQSQYVEATGTIYDSAGNGISYAPVIVKYPNFSNHITADINGVYYDSALLNIGQVFQVQTIDCIGDTINGTVKTVTQGQTIYVEDFIICDSASAPPCTGMIVQNINGFAGSFSVNTAQPGGTYQWDINGTQYSGANATHTFPGPGMYGICVTYSSVLCTFVVCDTVVISNPPSGFDLAGNVFKSNVWAQSGLAFLYAVDSTPAGGAAMIALDTTTLDSGMYFFSNLNPGIYRVQAMLDPTDPDFLNFFPTYYGDVVSWSNASDIILNSGSYQNNINLVPASSAAPGPGTIGGNVVEGPNKAFGPGDPLKDVIVILRDASANELEYDLTDANGDFSFDNIALGDYQIVLEIANEMMSPHLVSLSAAQTSSIVSFEYDTLGVRVVLGFEDELKSGTSIFPNPATEVISVELSSSEIDEAVISISDLQGKVLKQLTLIDNYAQMEISELTNGVYMINISTDKGRITKRFVKQ